MLCQWSGATYPCWLYWRQPWPPSIRNHHTAPTILPYTMEVLLHWLPAFCTCSDWVYWPWKSHLPCKGWWDCNIFSFSVRISKQPLADVHWLWSHWICKAREWNRTLSSCVDAYRQMLIMTDEAASKALWLTDVEELALKCPQCFGPGVEPLPEGEPCHCVCIDGNFQHRRHLAASLELGGIITPAMFIPPEEVEAMRDSLTLPRLQSKKKNWGEAEVVSLPTHHPFHQLMLTWHLNTKDPCTARHTAADDVRGKNHWKGNDETGLEVLACRHDQCLKFISIIQSGEKWVIIFSYPTDVSSNYIFKRRNIYPLSLINWLLRATEGQEGKPDGRLGVLYDIGCNIKKGIEKVI